MLGERDNHYTTETNGAPNPGLLATLDRSRLLEPTSQVGSQSYNLVEHIWLDFTRLLIHVVSYQLFLLICTYMSEALEQIQLCCPNGNLGHFFFLPSIQNEFRSPS